MAWTYSGNPSRNPLDAVRFEVQDTDENAQLLQDAEIDYALVREAGSYTQVGSRGVLRAAAFCLEVLARRFAAQADTQIGTLQTTYSAQARVYAERANELRRKATEERGAPWAGGLSRAEKETQRQDIDRVQPAFSRDEFIGPRQGRSPLLVPGEGE